MDKLPLLPEIEKNAWVNSDQYMQSYRESIENPEKYWEEQASRIHWFSKWTKVKNTRFEKPVSIRWFEGGKLNASYNCVDRHLKDNGDKIAILWEPDEPTKPSRRITYRELHQEMNRWANVLKKMGVKKGDVVSIYMPMIPETAFAMLACARLGAVHSVIFAGFAADSIADRLNDCGAKFVLTTDGGFRGGKHLDLKGKVDQAVVKAPQVKNVLVFRYSQGDVAWNSRDIWFHEAVQDVETHCEPEVMDAEDPLFILYTSGSTGKPKGVLHTTGGYLVFASHTHQNIFDYHPEDIYWCSADVGWVTGHSYIVYGPLANAATTLMFEGIPSYPDSSRFWQVVDKYQVSIFYTSPTALRALMREGESFVKKSSRKSLRVLGSVGEPINPEAWMWFHRVVGEERCPIVDTWWQTETGGILISPLPGAIPTKPGSATLPYFGVAPVLLTPEGQVIEGAGEGVLAIKDSWPGQMRTVYGDHKRFEESYFSTYAGYYFTGDGCRRDEDGYYWITGRVDDVLNISGHRLGTAEIESAVLVHSQVAEAAVVGYPHDIKGQGIYIFVVLKTGVAETEEMRKEIIEVIRQEIGPIATPDLIQFASGLPKTRSGKIMRRILRKIAENALDNLGDTSTLAEPSVVDALIQSRLNK